MSGSTGISDITIYIWIISLICFRQNIDTTKRLQFKWPYVSYIMCLWKQKYSLLYHVLLLVSTNSRRCLVWFKIEWIFNPAVKSKDYYKQHNIFYKERLHTRLWASATKTILICFSLKIRLYMAQFSSH